MSVVGGGSGFGPRGPRFTPPVNVRHTDPQLDRVRQNMDRQIAELQAAVGFGRTRTRRYPGWNCCVSTDAQPHNRTTGHFISGAAQGVLLPTVEEEGERLLLVQAAVEAPAGTVTLTVRTHTAQGVVTSMGASAVSSGTAIQLLSVQDVNSLVDPDVLLTNIISFSCSAASQVIYLIRTVSEVL